MITTIPQLLFFVGAAGVLTLLVGTLLLPAATQRTLARGLTALLLAGFFTLSLLAIGTEGPLGFWYEHTRALWSSQIWFDLLIAASVAWVALLPRARRVGMNLWFWAVAVPAGGSLGVLAMLVRIQQLEAAPPTEASRG